MKQQPTTTPLTYAKSGLGSLAKAGNLTQMKAGSTPAPPSQSVLLLARKKREEQHKRKQDA
jgi:hypothetical protein